MITLIKLLPSVILLILAIFYAMFAIYCYIHRKDLKLGYSQMPAKTIDFIVIYTVPFILLLASINVYFLIFS